MMERRNTYTEFESHLKQMDHKKKITVSNCCVPKDCVGAVNNDGFLETNLLLSQGSANLAGWWPLLLKDISIHTISGPNCASLSPYPLSLFLVRSVVAYISDLSIRNFLRPNISIDFVVFFIILKGHIYLVNFNICMILLYVIPGGQNVP
jgi:hypothetical protein